MTRSVLLVVLMVAACGVEENDVGVLEQALDEENAIYNNAIYNNAIYNNGTFENGYAIKYAPNGQNPSWEMPWARVWTGPKVNGYSVAFSKKWGANFFTTSWTSSSTAVQYVEANGTGCAHPTSRVGSALGTSCSSLANRVCTSDPYCCATSWDQTCVNEANDFANDYTGTHATGVTGLPLPDSHSPCAATVNAGRSSCRTSTWSQSCVDDAYAKCYARYVTRPRVESGRLIADACVEPTSTGTMGCPNALPGSTPGECCRRSLVMYGVYQDFHKDDTTLAGDGYKVQWSSWEQESTPTGSQTVRATMVPDPCTGGYTFNGEVFVRSCSVEHHLWQLAGPGNPFYPDVPNAANTSTGEWNVIDPGHQNVRVRNVLVNLLTALTNTSNHFVIDLRYAKLAQTIFGNYWFDASDAGLLPPDPAYGNPANPELVIDDDSATDPLNPTRHYVFGHVVCKGSDDPETAKRTDTDADLCSSLNYSLPGNQGSPTTLRTIWSP